MKNSIKIFYASLAAYVCLGFILVASLGNMGVAQMYNIPTMPHAFSDITNLVWAAESIEKGYDPLYENPNDRYGRMMNHPRILQHIVSGLHLERFSIQQVGLAVIAIFVCSLALLFKELDKWSAILLSVAVISPPVILGVERCNHDLFIFSMVALGLRFTRGPWLFFGLTILAAFIKLFPVFAITYFLKYDWKRWLSVSFAFGLIFIGYLFYTRDDLSQIFQSTQKFYAYSYGSKVFISMYAHAGDTLFSKIALIPVVSMIICLSISLIASYGSRRWFLENDNEPYMDAFRVGAGVFLGTYLLGNNWDYRLIYLLLMIPQLTRWAVVHRQFVAQLTLPVLFLSLFVHWIAQFGWNQLIVDETANWVLFGLVFILIFRSIPPQLLKRLLPWVKHPEVTQ